MPSYLLTRLKRLESAVPTGRYFAIEVWAGEDDEAHIEAEKARLIRDEGMTDRDTLVIIRLRCLD